MQYAGWNPLITTIFKGDRRMLFMIVNLTHKDLSQEDMSELGRLAGEFYEKMPSGITLRGDWAATYFRDTHKS